MKPHCIEAVNAAYGREATPAEIRSIEQRLAKTMKNQAVKDQDAWLATPPDERMATAAGVAANEVLGEAQLKLRRQALQVVTHARLQQAKQEFPGTPMEWLAHTVAFHADFKGSVQSMEYRAKAIKNDALRQMIDTIHSTNPKFFGLLESPAGVRDLVSELHGEATGNAVAAAGAARFREIAEVLRQRFNRGGGDVGHRDDWGMPHHHSQVRVARAGQAAWRASQKAAQRAGNWIKDAAPPPGLARQTWVADVLPVLDRSKYLREDGSPMSEVELSTMLGEVWTTIATGGLNKLEPGQSRGSGMVANRGNASRQIHFKNADSYLSYQAKYGERAVFDVLVGHVSSLADNIAAVETFGPNPDQAFRFLKDQAMSEMTIANPAASGKVRRKSISVENMFNLTTGKTLPVASERMAHFFDTLRNSLVANRLGSAFLTSITDEGTMMRTAAINNLPQVKLWSQELKAFNLSNREEKRMANRAGLALNTMVDSLNRFGNDTLGSTWSSKIAGATLRLSGLNAATDARRRAFGISHMSAIGHVTRKASRLSDLDPSDNRILLSKGITDTDFAVWKLAEQEDWGAGYEPILTPESIYRIPDEALAKLGDPIALREEAATKLLGAVFEETDVAVIEPGIRERAITRSNMQRGTISGELMRSAWLFKSFPLSMVTKHWVRSMSEPGAARKVKSLAALTTSTTVLGLVALQAAAMRDGKDPYDLTEGRTWMAALLKGGALSIFGDFMFSEQTQSGRGLIATMLGPVASVTEEALALTWGNALQAANGEETDFGAEAVKFAKGNTPGLSAVMNLWYARAAFDHLVVHDLQEMLSPGYLQRMQDRARDKFGQSYWWAPGGTPIDALNASGEDFAPERAPDIGKLKGEE